VARFTLRSGAVEVSVISWGATITSLRIGGQDVVLGFDDMTG
jgi:galactose mutarotase-like enzyme